MIYGAPVDPKGNLLREQLQLMYVRQNYPEKMYDYVACGEYDPPKVTCQAILKLDFAQFKEQEPALTAMLKAEAIEAAKLEIKNSPSIYINDKPYLRTSYLAELLPTVNAMLPKDKRISSIRVDDVYPPAKLFTMGSGGKIGARDTAWEAKMMRGFPNLEIIDLDKNLDKNKKLVEKLGIKYFPAYFFAPDLKKNTELFTAFTQRGLITPAADHYVFRYPGPRELIGQKPAPGELTLFVMSQCPFGVQAENTILQALKQKTLPENFRLKLRFIVRPGAEKDSPKWTSMHGTAELDEDIRQIIIQKYFPDKLAAYLEARNPDYRSDTWQEAAVKAGLDIDALNKHMPEGEALLASDYSETSAINVTASPTFLWENRYILGSGTDLKYFMNSNPFETPETTKGAPASCQ